MDNNSIMLELDVAQVEYLLDLLIRENRSLNTRNDILVKELTRKADNERGVCRVVEVNVQ